MLAIRWVRPGLKCPYLTWGLLRNAELGGRRQNRVHLRFLAKARPCVENISATLQHEAPPRDKILFFVQPNRYFTLYLYKISVNLCKG